MPDIGVIFDIDGVLVDSYRAHLESWARLAAERGLAITEAQFAATFGRTSRDIIMTLFGTADDAEDRRMDDRKEAIYRDLIRGRVPAMPGALELVRALHAAGVALAVGSSGPPENVDLVCTELGLNTLLAARVTGMDVQRGKPDPQVFLLAAERMGLPPRACVVIEDAPAGVEAARRAGMRSIALTGTHPRAALSAADRVVDRLSDIDVESVRAMPAVSPGRG